MIIEHWDAFQDTEHSLYITMSSYYVHIATHEDKVDQHFKNENNNNKIIIKIRIKIIIIIIKIIKIIIIIIMRNTLVSDHLQWPGSD